MCSSDLSTGRFVTTTDAAIGKRSMASIASSSHASTISYVAACCRVALDAGLLPHSNPGLMTSEDLALLRPLNASLGLMLESTSPRLRFNG